MANYLTFTSEATGNSSLDRIWYNYLMTYANNTEKLVGDGTNHYFLSELESMTEAQVCALKGYGKKQGVIQNSEGFTVRYNVLTQANNDPGLYFVSKPDESLMTGVTGYVEKEYDPNWWPPVDE